MTETEIVRQLKCDKKRVSSAIYELAEEMSSIKSKFHNGKLFPGAHFSLEETEAIYKKLHCNKLQILYMKEHFVEQPEPDIYEIPGTHKFLKEYKDNPAIKCCNTCKYLRGVTGSHKMPQPYCKVYERYLENFNAKVYEDWCSSYCSAKLPKPRQWFKENAPINLNMYGETGTINGIDNSKMMNTERSVKGVVTRVDQVGFDD